MSRAMRWQMATTSLYSLGKKASPPVTPARRRSTSGLRSGSDSSKMPMVYTRVVDRPAIFKTSARVCALALSPPSLMTTSTFFSGPPVCNRLRMVDQGLTFTEGKGSRCTAAVNSYATLQNTNFLYTKAGDHPDGTEITPAGRACKEGTRVAKVLRVTDKGAETLKLGEKEHCEDHKLAFTLSHSKYNQAIKELEGAYCAAGTTPVGGQICGPEFAKRFKDRTGIDFDQRQTIAECLLKKSSLRDDRKWHDAHPRTWSYDRDCRTVTYIDRKSTRLNSSHL